MAGLNGYQGIGPIIEGIEKRVVLHPGKAVKRLNPVCDQRFNSQFGHAQPHAMDPFFGFLCGGQAPAQS
jgi:hypothetical protein